MSGAEEARVRTIADGMLNTIGGQRHGWNPVRKTINPVDYSNDPDKPPLPPTAEDMRHAAGHGRIR